MIPLLLSILLSVQVTPLVQISTEVDTNGKYINWEELVVTWDMDQITTVPDHVPYDDDSMQTWYVPIGGNQYQKFTFERSIPGVYAVRWSQDDTLWSEPGVCIIVEPGQPIHGNDL